MLQVASAIAAKGIVMLIGSLPAGLLKDYFSRYPIWMMTASLLMVTAGNAAVPFCSSFPSLWVAFAYAYAFAFASCLCFMTCEAEPIMADP